jgi:hypothetical protein
MTHADHTNRAANIAGELIESSGGELGPEDRDCLRTIVRIAFEVQECLARDPDDPEARDWNQDTVLSGCDMVHLARRTWSRLGPSPGDTFPDDLRDLHRRLDEALSALQEQGLPFQRRVLALNQLARLQLIFLGATLW